MKGEIILDRQDQETIKKLVEHFTANRSMFESILDQLIPALTKDAALAQVIHSFSWRVKDADHLRDKLQRKMSKAREENRDFDITVDNLFEKINDLAGCRVLHLHTRHFERIHQCLTNIFSEFKYDLIEGPIAKTWDDESRLLFKQMGIATEDSPSLYTSVHYVIAPNRKTRTTCEIQVRTLAEELWGAVDHTVNYPHESESLPCREQIKVLARVTSSCTRLVDAIFSSHQDHKDQIARAAIPTEPAAQQETSQGASQRHKRNKKKKK
jgi:ppGpp synthetase/RelA/SpoT-type nucleotidyltranferase